MTDTKVNKGVSTTHRVTGRKKNLIKTMKSYGMTNDQIANVLQISLPTLNKFYPKELEFGKSDMLKKLADTVYGKALGGNLSACFFVLKTQYGWREKNTIEVTELPDIIINKLPKESEDK